MYYPYYLNGQTYGAAAPTNPVQQPAPQQQVPQTYQKNAFEWVQGEAGARGYMVPAGMTAWLMDSERQTFYIKSTDVSGIPQPLRIFDFTERTAQPVTVPEPKPEYVTKDEMKAYIAEIMKEKNHESSVQPESSSVTVSELSKHAN